MSQLNNLEYRGQGQWSMVNGQCMTHPLMLVIICAKYGKYTSRSVDAEERTRPDVPYISSFIAKSWLNDLADIGQGRRSLHATHPLIPVIIYAKYGNSPSRTVCAVEQTWGLIQIAACNNWMWAIWAAFNYKYNASHQQYATCWIVCRKHRYRLSLGNRNISFNLQTYFHLETLISMITWKH